jgi:SAM-dependent methyltransferase
MPAWWETFFDSEYLRLWEGAEAPEKTEKQVAGLWQVLGLGPGSRVLDAPCGYGRISRGLAVRGCQVVGVDQSAELLAAAERRRGDVQPDRLRYLRHDLRQPLPESGFDVALNIYSSLGYGTEADDLAILANLRGAVRSGGQLFVETMHRDRTVAGLVQNANRGHRLPDGTLVMEEPRLDPVAGRMHTTWYWHGPSGSGQKTGDFRVYSATELVNLLERAGWRVQSTYDGCSTEPFVAPGASIGGRLGVRALHE